jgi:hypothetical protein
MNPLDDLREAVVELGGEDNNGNWLLLPEGGTRVIVLTADDQLLEANFVDEQGITESRALELLALIRRGSV